MYYLYILYSTLAVKSYVGITDDPERRLREHNLGKSCFTSRYRPWVVIYLEEHKNKSQASNRERYLKSRSGRRWIKTQIFDNN